MEKKENDSYEWNIPQEKRYIGRPGNNLEIEGSVREM